VDVEVDADVPAIAQSAFEGFHIRYEDHIVGCMGWGVPESLEGAIWLISEVGWLGRMKLEELRLSDVTGWWQGYRRFISGRCPRRFRLASCRICR
jgi:hypothetical protein